MKKLSITAVLAFGVAFLVALSFCSTASADSSTSLNLDQLEKGDIVTLRGAYPFDPIIPGTWKHNVLYVGNDEFITSYEEGVSIIPMNYMLEVLENADDAAIYRVDTSMEVKEAAIEFAESQIGQPFDYGVFVWPGTKNPYSYAWYCSELTWAGYYRNDVDIDANPGYSYQYFYNVLPQELADDEDTYLIEDTLEDSDDGDSSFWSW